ncbi:uncharacterized protein [Procambarus clarkii]|uniref:uncharacterized protein n=1 Tax=Procambarus clarkii TaxID=6728 RepID=UPI003743093B
MKHFIKLCAVISLTTLISLISVYKIPPARRATGGSALPGHASCRSLFTITRAADNNLWFPEMSEAIRRVRHLLQKRSSPMGATSEDYRRLGELLPALLTIQDNNSTNGQGGNQTKREPSATLRSTTRLGATGGVLPYVPCTIAPFDDPATVTACLRKRLAKGALWIDFFGDSKLRVLFYEFLRRTDSEYHYRVKLQNSTKRFEELRLNFGNLHHDMEATTDLEPRLRITFSFRPFVEMVPSLVRESVELRQLGKWARGEERPPQLLLLGYTTWMMQRMFVAYSHDVYSYIMQMHRAVVPLLQQISQKTRVLVIAESRYREHAVSNLLKNYRILYGDASIDWSAMVFLYYLQQYKQQQSPHPPSRASTAHTTPVTWSQDENLHHDGPTPKAHSQTILDHMVPREADGGVWWWDTGLPLNMAAIGECDELYHRGLASIPAYNGAHLNCYDFHHAGTATLSDMVTMLFNLMCNSLSGAHSTFCCS